MNALQSAKLPCPPVAVCLRSGWQLVAGVHNGRRCDRQCRLPYSSHCSMHAVESIGRYQKCRSVCGAVVGCQQSTTSALLQAFDIDATFWFQSCQTLRAQYYTALRDAAKYSCSTRWHIQDGTYGTDPIGSHTGTCSKLLPGLPETASRGSHCSFRTSCWRSQHLWRQLSSMSVRPGRSRHR